MDEAQQKALQAQRRIKDDLVKQGYPEKHAEEVAKREAPTPAQKRQGKDKK